MQCAENQMPRQGRLNSNIRNNAVSNLTNQHNIGCLSKHCSQNLLKGQANIFSDLALVHTCEIVLYGVFGGDYLLVGLVQLLQRRIKGCGFTASRRPSNQKDAVGSFDYPLKPLIIFLPKAQRLDTDVDGVRPQNSKYHTFAVITRQSRHTEINALASNCALNTTILWQPFFSNIHSRQNLQTRKHRRLHILRNIILLQTNTVDTVPHPNSVRHRLYVYITGTHVIGTVYYQIHELDNRSFIITALGLGPQGFGLQFVTRLGKLRSSRVDAVFKPVFFHYLFHLRLAE